MNNQYCQTSIDNWNQALRKSKIFFQSFAKRRIRTLYASSYIDEVTGIEHSWEKGVEISLQEIVLFKLYHGWDGFNMLRHEVKKCYRWDTLRGVLPDHEEEADVEKALKTELEQRLREFFYLRSGLSIILNKFGRRISEDNIVLYHGVNAKMILNPGLCIDHSCSIRHSATIHSGDDGLPWSSIHLIVVPRRQEFRDGQGHGAQDHVAVSTLKLLPRV